MFSMRVQFPKNRLKFLYLVCNFQKKNKSFPSVVSYYATTIDIDTVASDLIERYRNRQRNNVSDLNAFSVRFFMDRTQSEKDVTKMSEEETLAYVLELISKNNDNKVEALLLECRQCRKFIGELPLNKLLRHYSAIGKPDIIVNIQKYCFKSNPNLYKRCGEYTHYVAKAECLRGNSEKGLSMLKECYQKYDSLKVLYRIILRELIQDSVLNRSEATLVIFKKYVIDFSETFNDHYPLICLWHVCWASNWYSDQMLANELLDNSEMLRNIVMDKAIAFSITVLRDNYNDDAVLRLLQNLLKYEMIDEYTKVLNVLFNFKLKNRDLRGCTEIIKNCEVLGITLPSYQQGRYIKMLIRSTFDIESKKSPDKPTSKDFKLKF